MRFGSLFAGIGGIDLGLQRAGMSCAWQVENDEFCCRVLAKHWPHVPRYGDIRTLDPADLEPVDLIAGGFPCQPVSVAGKRRGRDDERWLWPEFYRIVRALRPRFVLVENVPGLLSHGFGDVLGGLAELGYDAEWDCLPAAAFGAPHLRYRAFLVAYCDGEQLRGRPGRLFGPPGTREGQTPEREWVRADAGAGRSSVANSDSAKRRSPAEGRNEPNRDDSRREEATGGPGLGGEAGRGGWWATEPDVGRVANGVPSRVDRLRGLGNAVVPQLAEWIGRRLMDAEANAAPKASASKPKGLTPTPEGPQLPFRAAFRQAILDGRKTATSRNERYGWPGDVLTTPFGDVRLTDVYQQTLGKIRATLWREEGVATPEEFERIWRGLHRGHFDPLKVVWVHRFVLAP